MWVADLYFWTLQTGPKDYKKCPDRQFMAMITIEMLEFTGCLGWDMWIFKHLKFNYYSIGKSNKLEILDKWLQELNLNYNDIAYIGDDLSDLEIQQKVKFFFLSKWRNWRMQRNCWLYLF